MKNLFLILLVLPCLLYSQNNFVKVDLDYNKVIGQMWVDTIKGNWVTFVAGSDYDIDLMKYERIIYRDNVIFKKDLIDCDPTERYFGGDDYFEAGHSYEIVIVNPATRKVIYLPCKFKL